jgi:hypothetical protein
MKDTRAGHALFWPSRWHFSAGAFLLFFVLNFVLFLSHSRAPGFFAILVSFCPTSYRFPFALPVSFRARESLYIYTETHTHIHTHTPPHPRIPWVSSAAHGKDEQKREFAFFLSCLIFRFFRALFSSRFALFFGFALASTKAQKSAGAHLWRVQTFVQLVGTETKKKTNLCLADTETKNRPTSVQLVQKIIQTSVELVQKIRTDRLFFAGTETKNR